MTDDNSIAVEVTYAEPHKQRIVTLNVPEGTTALEAAQQSGLDKEFEQLDLEAPKLGIFGKAVKADRVLADGERVEIYRPLIADPKEVRKKRAAKKTR